MSTDRRRALAEALEPAAIAATLSAVTTTLADAARSGRLIVVGSALLPQKVIRAVRAAGGDVAAVVEFAPRFWGREVEGLPVLSLDQALGRVGADAVALVGIWSPQHIYAETRAWLEAAGVRTVLPVNAAFWAHADHLGAHYQFGDPTLYGARAADILAVYDRLADEESRRQFAGIVQFRVTLDPAHTPLPSYKRIYFDPAVATLPENAVIADVGAFSGDTLDILLYWRGTRFGRVVAFEPDPLSFARLDAFRAALPPAVAGKIECVNAAVGRSEGVLRFSATGLPGTKSSETGEVEVRCLTLDDYFAAGPLHYIKVDVEGAEGDVLAGAWSVIARERPIIGLSVYHAPEDLFALPLDVMHRVEEYEYLFRAHDFDGIDFILYAVPVERSARGVRRPGGERDAS